MDLQEMLLFIIKDKTENLFISLSVVAVYKFFLFTVFDGVTGHRLLLFSEIFKYQEDNV
jgi:hypothetical protein